MSVKTIPANEYVAQLLHDRDSIHSSEFPMNSDFDYVMSMMITMEYDAKTSPYQLEFLEGQAHIGRYSIPNMIVSRR